MPGKPKTGSAIAAFWRTTERTITAWKSAGAPLGDAREMRTWLAGRKHLPPGTRAKLNDERAEQMAASAEDYSDLQVGAASALARLEQAEAGAYRQLETALKSGNPLSIKLARDGWLRVSESLRKYD